MHNFLLSDRMYRLSSSVSPYRLVLFPHITDTSTNHSVLMQWAEGGSLDDLIDIRLGRRTPAHLPHLQPSTPDHSTPSPAGSPAPDASVPYSRSARIRAFRTYQRASPAERERLRRELGLDAVNGLAKSSVNLKAVHLFGAEEVKSLFRDVTAGLAFLVRGYFGVVF